MAAGRLRSPEDVVRRLAWQSTGEPDLRESERLYRAAFVRYLKGRGIVKHPQVVLENLTPYEQSIPNDHALARAEMFLTYATGSPLLPRNNSKIDVRSSILCQNNLKLSTDGLHAGLRSSSRRSCPL